MTYVGNNAMKLLHLAFLRSGHVAVKYTLSNGHTRMMNILGGSALSLPGGRMVNFVEPSDYLYGTRGFETYCQQGGCYNRDMISLRVQRVSKVTL